MRYRKPGTTGLEVSEICHPDDAVGALELTLAHDEVAALEEPYAPHAIAGHV